MYYSNNIEKCWIFQGKCLTEPPDGFYGFIYKITNLDNGSIYIGKKCFTHLQKVKLSKKARKESGTRKRIERRKKDSGWLDYFGSSEFLLKDLEANNFNCTREVLKLCKDKSSLTYWELAHMVENKVLFRDDCYNGNISGRIFKGRVHE
jgi:hypothetical protein